MTLLEMENDYVKCPNYVICQHEAPQEIFDCNFGTCINCATMWGILEFINNLECPICLETKTCVKQLNCDHKICTDCFRRCQYREEAPQPRFPYSPEIEDEYDNDWHNPKWRNDPLIIKYRAEWIQYDINEENKYESEAYLRLCSLCRK